MFDRNLLRQLHSWKESKDRKPLILRGARQTGKTTLVKLLSPSFQNVVTLNLESSADRRHFEGTSSVQELIRTLEVASNSRIEADKTLIFLDEVQNAPGAVQLLRYFYEVYPKLHVIATGSLLEVALREKGISFPVGRVTFLYVYPLSFDEFLTAMGKSELRKELESMRFDARISSALHKMAVEQFQEFVCVGGMPEPVNQYQKEKSYQALIPVREALLTALEDDVPKYATRAQTPYLQFLIQHAPNYAGQRIQYANFGESGFRGREMKHAFETLERAMVVQRVFGTPQVALPLQPNYRVAPKLLALDVGLVMHRLGVDIGGLRRADLTDAFRGALAEQVVGQALIAQSMFRKGVPHFWYRSKLGSSAEVDYVVAAGGQLIPVEVKSGTAGQLRSLQQFITAAPHANGVRIYGGELKVETCQTSSGKKWNLLSLPFYLSFRLSEIVEEWIRS